MGICGTGMASLAGLLKERGFSVTGSDRNVYPPMSDFLKDLGIPVLQGYAPANLESRPDLVIVGNVITRDNPEAVELARLGLPYLSLPQALRRYAIEERQSLVVAGTHGKTTTSSLAAWVLETTGLDPGFMIGGIPGNFSANFKQGTGPHFVIEGDEYDSAFFDKGPKFLHYRPQALIVTSIEFDHADIYSDISGIISSFERLVPLVPPDGILVLNAEDERVMALSRLARARIVTYAVDDKADYIPRDVTADASGTSFSLPGVEKRLSLPMWGRHNLLNCAGVLAALIESGIDAGKLAKGLSTFEGVKRRQELIGEAGGVSVIDDFAHHPTAVAGTIESMRSRFPEGRIWAIFEPRSNTSRRNVFERDFARALALADRVIVASPFKSGAIPKAERFDSRKVADAIMRSGKDSHHIDGVDNIVEFVMRGIEPGDVLLVMSNGGFGGLTGKLADALKTRRTYASSDEIPYSKVPK
jgi:UDP-N-acetylmuramate: L-alanyl-gamma-D-glutamyl-meso-diaminopimelate ligase